MIVLKANAESSSASPVNFTTTSESSDGKSSLSFGELLRGEGTKVDLKHESKGQVVLAFDEKEVVLPNVTAPQAKEEDTKASGLLSLLKGDAAILGEEIEALELHPKIVEQMSVKEIKTLINDAKSYLKEQILNSDGYKNSQMKELPQTLKGLAQLAQKFDINISKITIEQVQTTTTTIKSTDVDIDTKNEKTTKQANQTLEVDDAPDIKVELKVDKKAPKLAKMVNADTVDIQKDVKQDAKVDTKVNDSIKATQTGSIKETSTPLFKAQSTAPAVSTEQVVQAKQFVAQPSKTPKDRADETLKLLLRGEKPTHSAANMTADFSVATAKVIAPNATTDASRSLEALLRGDSSGQTAEVKTEQMAIPKADSFEVKLNEAKQMVKYLSTDVKQAIDDYKSPFTRIKVQLNPQQLGDVELTVIQRGKNLHVNISSNTVAVNALATHLGELKTQLSNNGINNATFNFNSGSENGSSSNEQQSRQKEQQDANEEYNYFENQEQHEEVLSSLEIIVPSYA